MSTVNNNKILCTNMIKYRKCDYGYKCVFAHSLSDQKVDSLRQRAYNIIKNKYDIKTLDLISDRNLLKTFIELTTTCSSCSTNNCIGGYNCKHGAINKKYTICYTDMMRGTCNANCGYMHLTKLGLVPYSTQKKKLDLSSSSYSPNNNNYYNMYEETGNNITNQIKDLSFAKKIFKDHVIDLGSDSDEEYLNIELSDDDSDEMIFD